MFIFIIIFIIIVVIAIIYFLLPLIKEESATIKEEINEAKKEEESRKKPVAHSLKSLLEEKTVAEILPKISDDPRKIQKLKVYLQDELKEAMRQKNSQKISECNQNLRAVQAVENKLKGN